MIYRALCDERISLFGGGLSSPPSSRVPRMECGLILSALLARGSWCKRPTDETRGGYACRY